MPETTQRPLRVIVADDHPSVRENLRYLLNAEDDLVVIAVAKDGIEAISMALDLGPDILVVDSDMPGLDGVDVLRRLRRERPTIGIVMFTLESQICDIALRAGAIACVTKDSPPERLLEGIRAGRRDPSTPR